MSATAIEVAGKLLSGRDFSVIEMRARLIKRGFESDQIEEVITELSRLGYLTETGDDHQRLCQMAREYIQKRNKTEITPSLLRAVGAYLIRKGFDHDLVNDYLQQLSEIDN